MVSILLIDTDEKMHVTLRSVLPDEYKIFSAYSGEEGMLKIQTEAPELVLLSDNIHDIAVFELLQQISNSPYAPPIIMISGNCSFTYVVQAVQNGAHMFIRKPIHVPELKSGILAALQRYTSIRSSYHTDRNIPELSGLIGTSDKIQQVKRLIHKYAPSQYPLLIKGESGTGKDLIAEAVHALSPRREGPFIAKNCGAIAPSLIQSELFGSEKGAYTDAISRPGSFELADSGSIFLDEIGEMDLHAQVNLLRVLENREVTRVGGTRKIRVNVRIISATNKNLYYAIKKKEFRHDLYYRINTLILTVPPLRERKSDIPALARHFITQTGHNHYVLGSRSLQKLSEYNWPGNVRELKAAIQRSLLLAEDNVIEPNHIIINQ